MFQTLRSHRRIPHQKARALTAALVLNAKFPQLHHSPKPNSLRVQRKRTAAHETLPLVVGRRKKKKKNKKKRPKNTLQRRLEAHPLPACHAGRTPRARPLAEPRAGSAARWVGVGAGRPRGNPTPPSPQRPFAPQSAACSVGGEGGGLVYKSPYSLPIIESLRGGRASFPPLRKKARSTEPPHPPSPLPVVAKGGESAPTPSRPGLRRAASCSPPRSFPSPSTAAPPRGRPQHAGPLGGQGERRGPAASRAPPPRRGDSMKLQNHPGPTPGHHAPPLGEPRRGAQPPYRAA